MADCKDLGGTTVPTSLVSTACVAEQSEERIETYFMPFSLDLGRIASRSLDL